MPEQISSTTNNGFEIAHPREKLDFDELKAVTKEYGLEGDDPAKRIESFKRLSTESVAMLLSDINRRLIGSEQTMIHEKAMRIENQSLIRPEDRYGVFSQAIDLIKSAPVETEPAKIGDALGLLTVITHPFKDGNGRTARMMGFIFRKEFDQSDAAETFKVLADSRDQVRKSGGWMINGYIPRQQEGVSQSNPRSAVDYIKDVLSGSENNYSKPLE